VPTPMLNYADWELSPEQRMIQSVVREFVEQEALPLMPACFEEGRFPRELIPRYRELGLFGPTIPEYGAGVDATSYGLICQELERGDTALRAFMSVQSSLCMYPIWSYGSEEQKRRYLPAMQRGEVIGCFGLTEPDHGSDPASMETRASRDGDGSWVLNGTKMWITNGGIADLALVWAKVREDDADVVHGFLVERDRPGFAVTDIRHRLALRASVTSELVFQDCRVPADAVLPNVRGMRGPLSAIGESRFGVAFGAVGAAMACYETALEYSGVREQWGRPIAGFQLIQARLVDALQAITQGQLLAYQIGRLKDAGRLRPAQASLAKRANCAMALEVARSMRSVLGGNGISLEYPIIRHMNNLEATYTYEGTHEIQTLVLGADITGHEAFRG
jgi:glutaryl-CoA dehydrogenase